MNSNEICAENVTYDDLKSDKKHSFMLYTDIIFQCILRVNACIILE